MKKLIAETLVVATLVAVAYGVSYFSSMSFATALALIAIMQIVLKASRIVELEKRVKSLEAAEIENLFEKLKVKLDNLFQEQATIKPTEQTKATKRPVGRPRKIKA